MKQYLRLFIPIWFHLFFCLGPIVNVQAQSDATYWKWTKVTSDSGTNIGQEAYFDATDANGNVFVCGLFGPVATFDTVVLTVPYGGLYLVKYSPSGQMLWARDAPCTCGGNTPQITGLATDPVGNVYMIGNMYADTLNFNGITIAVPQTAYSMFIAKYDASGNIKWAKGGGQGEGNSLGIATDNLESAYVTGGFFGDSFTLGNTTLHSQGDINNEYFFLAKYDVFGNVLWMKGAVGDTGGNSGNYIASDNNDNIYISGSFYGDSISLGTHTIYSGDPAWNHNHNFLAKYDSVGNVIWGKLGYYGAISPNIDKNLYLLSSFSSNSVILGNTTLYCPDTNYAIYGTYFLSRYDTSGNLICAKVIGLGYTIIANSIAANERNGIIYLSAGINENNSNWPDSMVFGSTTLYLAPFPSDPMFLLVYDTSGNIICGASLTSGGDDYNWVSTDAAGNAYVFGDYYSASVNPFIVGSDSFSWRAGFFGERLFTSKFNCNMKSGDGIGQIESNSFLSLCPNPVSAQATVAYRFPDDKRGSTLAIYDILGNRISEYTLLNSSGKIDINCQRFNSGVYFYSLESDGKTILTKRMILAK